MGHISAFEICPLRKPGRQQDVTGAFSHLRTDVGEADRHCDWELGGLDILSSDSDTLNDPDSQEAELAGDATWVCQGVANVMTVPPMRLPPMRLALERRQ